MKIVAFAGSPRLNGNSDILLDQFIKGAKQTGAEVDKIYLDQKDIAPCKACDFCRANGFKCLINDDMQPIYAKLEGADVWVLATPIYWWGPTAQLKLMIDRWYSFYKGMDCSRKRVAIIITMGDKAMKTAQPTLDMFDMAFTALNMEQIKPLIVVAGPKGAVSENTEALEKAYQMGLGLQ